MYRTIFGLLVSLKLFLGRFDMRTMQARFAVAFAPTPLCLIVHGHILHCSLDEPCCNCVQAATSVMPPGVGRDPPSEGDGYTFEHLAGRAEAWLDFMADTGDGGNPT